jgi:RND family efflux transporter MFP subunit
MKEERKVLRVSIALAIAVCLLLAACHKNEPVAANGAPGIPEVGVFTVQPQAVTLSTELPGRTTAYLIAEVRPQVGGILLKRLFVEGSDVKAGQTLYQIDPASYRATLARAQASLESARLLAQRYEHLIKTGAISQQEYDDARSSYLQAKASAETARINLDYTSITAPISGRIGRSSVTQGALVTANQSTALATVQQLDPIYVDIVQPSTAILQLKEYLASGHLKRGADGQAEVRLRLENGKPYPLAGKLQFSEVSVDQGTGAVTLRAVFPNPEGLLLPGMFVHAQFQEGVREHALLVPQRGITRDSTGQALALVVGAEDKVEQRKVTIERSVGTSWLVSDGLTAGDRVIVDGVQNVRPGGTVKTVAAGDNVSMASK